METNTTIPNTSTADPGTATAPPEPEVSPTQAAEAEVSTLEAKVKLLTDLRKSVNDLRQIPGHLLRPQSALSSVLPIPQSEQTRLREEFERIKSVSEKLRSSATQDALTLAKTSEAKDHAGISRQNRRKLEPFEPPSNAPTPESPQPYPSFQSVNPSLFPPWDNTTPQIKIGDLPGYIKESNRTHSYRLHVWSYKRQNKKNLSSPLILRFTIRDVFAVYVTLDTKQDDILIAESATAFGTREKKPPHSQSDYLVYQSLSQQLIKMVNSQPMVSFQQMIALLKSYSDLFVRRCSSCERVVSLEGHVPPVARIWVSQSSSEGHWDARHATCPQH